MAIFNNSRYMGQTVMTIPTAEGNQAVVFGAPNSMPPTFVYYTVVQGDRFDLIAEKLFGVPDYWWKIASANPEIFYPDMLIAGSIIRLPAS